MNPEKHRDAILALWGENLAKSFKERFNWFYEQNPAGPAKTWLTFENNNKQDIIGCGSLYPRLIKINGKDIRIGIAADFAINKNHRVFGPALKIQRVISGSSNTAGFKFVFAFPNNASKGVFSRVGYRVVGQVTNWNKLLNVEQKISNYIKIKVFTSLLGFLINQVIWLLDFRHQFFKPLTMVTETLDACDERFDTLWSRAQSNFNIIGERSSAYLNWRYIKWKGDQYKLFCLFNKEKSDLMGYLVYNVQDKIALVRDIFTIDFNKTPDYLLVEFFKQMRKDRLSSISITYLGSQVFKDKLKKFNFFERETKRSCMIFLNKGCDENLKRKVLEENNWFLLDGEMDL